MVEKKSALSGTYTVANPYKLPPHVPVFTCVRGCDQHFFEGDTFDATAHPHLTNDRIVRKGLIVKAKANRGE